MVNNDIHDILSIGLFKMFILMVREKGFVLYLTEVFDMLRLLLTTFKLSILF